MLNRRVQQIVQVYTCQNAHCWKSHAAAQLKVFDIARDEHIKV